MASRRRSRTNISESRTALLDAAERLMLEEGYASVTSRRISSEVGVNVALVYYYFASMDDLFIELFRRGADLSLQRQSEILTSPQPLWGLWEMTHHLSNPVLTIEFQALANHRKAIRAEISRYATMFRTMQLDVMTSVLEGYGLKSTEGSPESIILIMAGISRYLLTEQLFDVHIAHDETVELVEKHIRRLEGPRPTSAERPAETLHTYL